MEELQAKVKYHEQMAEGTSSLPGFETRAAVPDRRTYDAASDNAFHHTGEARPVPSPPRGSAAHMSPSLDRQAPRTGFNAEQTMNRTNSRNNVHHPSSQGDNESNSSNSSHSNDSDENHGNDTNGNFFGRETISLSSLNTFSEPQMPARQFLTFPESHQGDSFDLLRTPHIQNSRNWSKDITPEDMLHQSNMVQDQTMNFDLFDGKCPPKIIPLRQSVVEY
jgi:hypothetical protein